MCFRELLDGLRRVGFKLTMGEDDTGFFQLALGKAGGYYFGKLFRTFYHEPIDQSSFLLQMPVLLS
jgi:hypothetical protein